MHLPGARVLPRPRPPPGHTPAATSLARTALMAPLRLPARAPHVVLRPCHGRPPRAWPQPAQQCRRHHYQLEPGLPLHSLLPCAAACAAALPPRRPPPPEPPPLSAPGRWQQSGCAGAAKRVLRLLHSWPSGAGRLGRDAGTETGLQWRLAKMARLGAGACTLDPNCTQQQWCLGH